MNEYKPVPGAVLFRALHDKKSITMACNTRIVKGVVRGIMRAAKTTDSAVIFELAKSECDLKGGYTGLTPKAFSEQVHNIAREVKHDIWALHADHTTVKKGSPEEIQDVKKLLDAIINAGYTSFSIDASVLFNTEGKTVEEELAKNIEATAELAKYIENKRGSKDHGLEVEVGEIGKTDANGRVLTTPEEAVAFVKALNRNGVDPQVLAIANGSAHGNIFDESGKPIAQVSIDIPLTKKVAKSLYDNNLGVRIAQHGITGTPLEFINAYFPKGDITKGNVGTFWMNIVWDALKIYQPELYKDIWDWTLSTYKEESAKKGLKTDEQIFGIYSKNAIKVFFDRIYAVDKETEHAIESAAYSEALKFFRAFSSEGSATIVREHIKSSVGSNS